MTKPQVVPNLPPADTIINEKLIVLNIYVAVI